MLLSVIIVSYNVKDYLYQCLYSLSKALDGIDAEIIVFDNHSRDNSVESLSKEFPNVTFISSNHNLGFAYANNRAIEQSKGEYVLILNPDTIIGEDVIRKSINFMNGHTAAGAVGVRMIKSDGGDAMESRRGTPTPMTAFYKMSGLCKRFPSNRHLGRYYMGWLSWDEPGKIEVVSGACAMIRRKALDEVGLFDEDFFMYGEDIDLSYRLLRGGWENWYLPVHILHYKGESTEKSSFRYVHVFYEAMLIFFRKHYKNVSVLFSVPIKCAIYSKATIALLSMLMRRARRSLGFVSKPIDSHFIFYVKPCNMQRCRKMAQHKGLWAEFHDANKNLNEVLPQTDKKCKTYITYDVSEYSFKEMFERIGRLKKKNVSLATYYPDKDMVITTSDVIK